MSKVVLIDGGTLTFKSIHAWSTQRKKQIEGKISEDQFIMPSHYVYFSMIISALKKIGINKEDIIIIANDGRSSFRKAFYPEYKGQRKALRDKEEHVDWLYHWKKIDEINQSLHNYSQINVIKLDYNFSYEDLINSEEGQKLIDPNSKLFDKRFSCEADDIIAVACKYYKDKTCIVVTGDKDLYTLDYFDNVKVFSTNLKTPKGKNGAYVIGCNPLKILNDKCRLGDVSDNIIIDKNFPEKDAEVRKFIIDVLNIPSFLKEPIENELKQLNINKKTYIEKLPFYKKDKKSLAHRFMEIYTDKNLVTWDYCSEYFKNKAEKNKKKRKVKC